MAAEVELLPLPPARLVIKHDRGPTSETEPFWNRRDVSDYARACVSHATAAKDAEIEILVKQRDFLVEEYERAVGCGPQGYTHAAMHLFNAIANAKADENTKAIEALRAKTAMTMGVGSGDGKLFVHGDYESIKAAQEIVLRAERLAEALREAEEYIDDVTPSWASGGQGVLAIIRAALHPAAEQESE